MHLVGFIIRIYHDERSSECQICDEIVCSCVLDWGIVWLMLVLVIYVLEEIIVVCRPYIFSDVTLIFRTFLVFCDC